MLLYELAITLDVRSTELADAAAELGLGELRPASDLDAQQVAALRAHFGGGGAPPALAPLGSAPPLPAPPMAPLAFGAPPPTAAPPSGGPTAPAAWGPPTAPTDWGPPPGAAPPAPGAPPAPPAAPAHVGPAFAYPEGPAAQGGAVPGAGAAAVFAPPPPPPTSPVPPAPAAASPSAGSGFGTGQKVLIGAVVAGVIALFGFMALNTGPDERRQQALAAKDAELEAELNATTAPIATTTVPEQPAGTEAPSTPTAYDVVDAARFCKGGLGITTFELRLTAAVADQDFGELSSIVRDRRAAWNDDVASLLAGAPPILVNDIERYRDGYITFFDAIASSTTIEQAYSKVDRMELIKAGNAGQEVSTQIANECD